MNANTFVSALLIVLLIVWAFASVTRLSLSRHIAGALVILAALWVVTKFCTDPEIPSPVPFPSLEEMTQLNTR